MPDFSISALLSMTSPSVPLIDAEHVAFMQGGVSISVGGCNADNMPSLSRAIGCRVSIDRREVTVFVAATHAVALLSDVGANGAIAVVFSQPSTNRTMQLKGRDARILPPLTSDLQLVDAYRDSFIAELVPLGYEARLMRAFQACAPSDVVALTFTPCAAFSQTPGPQAGEPLKTAA